MPDQTSQKKDQGQKKKEPSQNIPDTNQLNDACSDFSEKASKSCFESTKPIGSRGRHHLYCRNNLKEPPGRARKGRRGAGEGVETLARNEGVHPLSCE